MNKAYFNWSGGKDSSLALYEVLLGAQFDVQLLLTSVNSTANRISMHGVRVALLEAQARSIGLPLELLPLPEDVDISGYNSILQDMMALLVGRGLSDAIFGDIFLEDLRTYREKQLAKVGVKANFPIWKRDTQELVAKFIADGFKAIVVCVQSSVLDSSFVGREFDARFIADLPSGVDVCGENGEFHTFVYDGPIFKKPVAFTVGEKVYKEYPAPQTDDGSLMPPYGFWFCDLLPAN